jgi:hypothetical protein
VLRQTPHKIYNNKGLTSNQSSFEKAALKPVKRYCFEKAAVKPLKPNCVSDRCERQRSELLRNQPAELAPAEHG